MRVGAGLLALAALAACAQPPPTTIDGSSAEAFARSTEIARNNLPVADRLEFDRAIATVPARRYGNRDPSAAARTAFDGMTAVDIVSTERERTSRR
ncbi:MAG: hypothetical protein LH485_00490 [Sphingomonas bacterium]|nr:hypothetical protein [Sphingomonas bacterium]